MSDRNVLFTCPYGSRLYGLQTAKSDYDFKSIYLPELASVLACIPARVIQEERYELIDGVDTKIETEFIPLQKFMRDFFAGQTYALEMVYCLNHPGAQLFDLRFIEIAVEIKQFLTNNVKSMTGYAINQAMLYSVKGERLEAIVKLNDYLSAHIDAHPDILDKKVIEILPEIKTLGLNEKYVFETVVELNGKLIPSIQVLGKVHHGTIGVHEFHTRVYGMQTEYGGRARKAMEEKGVDWKALSHALRVTHEANQLLATGELTFPFTGDIQKLLLSAKLGEITFDEISDLLRVGLDELEENKCTTKLPTETENLRAEFEEWMMEKVMMIYGVTRK